jgi:hypothetical protein
MSRSARIWTWDLGEHVVDLDDDAAVVAALQTVLEGGLWKEFRKFPRRDIARVVGRLRVPAHTRRLIEIWIEDRPAA